MKRLAQIALTALLLGAIGGPSPALAEDYNTGTRCGIEMWAKKTLRDPGSSALHAPQVTTIAWLARQSAPADPDANIGRLAPVETSLWTVRAQLLGYRLEADSDYHLLLRDPVGGQLMIAEIPAPYCVTKFAKSYADERALIDKLGNHVADSHFWWLDYHGATPPSVSVTGVGFFDRLHDADGAADNGVELHPVLGLRTP